MRYVLPILLAMVTCLLLPAHVAGETLERPEVVKTLTGRSVLPMKTLAALTGLHAASPTECVAAEIRSARGYLGANYGDNARWAFADITFAGLTYADLNLVVIDSNLRCGYGMAVAFHEWMHIRTAEYFGSKDKARATLGCGDPMPEFPNTCRKTELIADCGGAWLSELTEVTQHHPYMDKYGCSQDEMLLAQQIIKGE